MLIIDAVSECPFLMSKIEEKNGTKTFGQDLKVRYEFDIRWKEGNIFYFAVSKQTLRFISSSFMCVRETSWLNR